MTYTQDLTLDLNSNSAYTVVNAKQGDVDSRILHVYYTKDGEQYKVSTANSVALRLRKPDMKLVFNNGTINSDGTVNVTLTQQCLTTAGRAYADLVEFSSAGQMLSTVSFIINIMASPNVMGGEALSSDEFLYLKSFIDRGNQVIDEAKSWATAAENNKNQIANMTASIEMISTDASPEVIKTATSNAFNLHFKIPQSYAAYITFDIDYTTGNLYMFKPAVGWITDEVSFDLNEETGNLEVVFDDGE